MIRRRPIASTRRSQTQSRSCESAKGAPLLARRFGALALLAGLSAAGPALAQSSGVGGQIGGFIQNIVDLLNSSVIRGLATIAVILTGIVWMFGHIDMRRAGTVVVGIIVIFSAAAIVDLIVGAG